MKVKCIANIKNAVPSDLLDNYSVGDFFSVEKEKEYIVYAVWVYLDYIWYCICNRTNAFYPFWIPSMLFEIIDHRLSRYWIFGIDEDNNKKVPFLSFPEWVNDSNFYEDLVDGTSNDKNASIFKKYKELMSLEFPDSSISETAQVGDDGWLICPQCIDAWQSEIKIDALVKCPKCETIFNNPRYNNEWPHLSGT